jgi:phage-related tail protein
MKTPNLKFILETILEDQPKPMTREEKQQFVQEVANFSALGDSVYGKGNLEEIVERVKTIVERAERIMTESNDWMSNVAHKKNNKRMHEDYRDFEQAARELKEAQDRMSLAYENIGQHLNRYFDVN